MHRQHPFNHEKENIMSDTKKPANKKLILGILFGIIAASISVYMWSRNTQILGVELGSERVWFGPILGFLTGFGVAIGNGFNKKSALIAVIIAFIALVGAKYVNAGILYESYLKSGSRHLHEKHLHRAPIIKDVPDFNNDNVIISIMADIIINKKIEKGDSISYPLHASSTRDNWKDDYPLEIWQKAEALWLSQPDSSKERYRIDTKKYYVKRLDVFIYAFTGLKHIIYIILTLIAAFIIPGFIKTKRITT